LQMEIPAMAAVRIDDFLSKAELLRALENKKTVHRERFKISAYWKSPLVDDGKSSGGIGGPDIRPQDVCIRKGRPSSNEQLVRVQALWRGLSARYFNMKPLSPELAEECDSNTFPSEGKLDTSPYIEEKGDSPYMGDEDLTAPESFDGDDIFNGDENVAVKDSDTQTSPAKEEPVRSSLDSHSNITLSFAPIRVIVEAGAGAGGVAGVETEATVTNTVHPGEEQQNHCGALSAGLESHADDNAKSTILEMHMRSRSPSPNRRSEARDWDIPLPSQLFPRTYNVSQFDGRPPLSARPGRSRSPGPSTVMVRDEIPTPSLRFGPSGGAALCSTSTSGDINVCKKEGIVACVFVNVFLFDLLLWLTHLRFILSLFFSWCCLV
jgi:hypothetical protein